MSLGGPPNLDPASPSMVPGIGLKFLRSGLEATNLFGLYTLDGMWDDVCIGVMFATHS